MAVAVAQDHARFRGDGDAHQVSPVVSLAKKLTDPRWDAAWQFLRSLGRALAG